MNILIVDDDLVDREHIKRTILKTDPDCSFTEADTVDEALKFYTLQKFDLVLLDYRMPQRNGIELLRELRKERLDHSVAIIMLSNSEDEELALECVRAGAQDFISKAAISKASLRRALLNAQTRFDLEQQLFQAYCSAKQLAEHDSLTGLANRFLFEETLKINIANNPRSRFKLAMLLFDLDHFKYINDNHGHDIGDLLLKGLVERINSCLRGNELFARLGGDEFAIVLNNLEREQDVGRIAERILRALKKPIDCAGIEISVSISIGISIYPDNSRQAGELFKFADIAMYRAKNMGRNQIVYFEEAMQQQFLQRYQIEHQLKQAVEQGQLLLHYQPVFTPGSLRLAGFEALLRWQVDGVLRMPDSFIEIAEESGQILEIGRWVINHALQQHRDWLKRYGRSLSISINLSTVQFKDPKLTETIRQCLDEYQVPPAWVEFELTETAFIENADAHVRLLNNIGQLGCRIALDDFGTGFSSVSHLHKFPINTVKIDKSLLLAQKNKKTLALIRGLTAMTHSLGLEVVAEGIENQESLAICKDLQVDRVQGFYFSKALPAAEIESLYLRQPGSEKVPQQTKIG